MGSDGSVASLSQALSHIVSGCYVLTLTSNEHGPQATVLSFVQQVAFDPPRIVVAIHKERALHAALQAERGFVLNVCAQGDDRLLTRFADHGGDLQALLDAVGARAWGAGLALAPAAAFLDCRVVDRVDTGDHWLYIADVRAGEVVTGRSPLFHVRKSGLGY
jgi:flavin reductase (DIM6/NTAB) family NADH-FMN oxidoreductase RutF